LCLGDANNLQGLQNLNLAALAAFAANSPGMNCFVVSDVCRWEAVGGVAQWFECRF